jgi:peptide/nickel transport system substrate-binding protein
MKGDLTETRALALGLAMALLVVILGACGGGAQATPTLTEAPTNTPEAPDSPTATPLAAATTTATPTGTRQGTLRVAAYAIAQTDPAYVSSDSEILIANNVYDYFVDVDADNQIQPRLAREWEHSQDGLIYTFTLASGVTFHDGSPFGPQDVVWTYNRLRQTAGLPTVDVYRDIMDIQQTGDLQVTFTLSETNPFFLYDLSDNHALMMKANTQDPTNFNGTGPFVVQQYSAEDRVVMTANENYFVEGEPQLAGLQVIFYSDQSSAADALRGGQIDLTTDLSTPLFESLQQQSGLTAMDTPTNQFAVVRLRTDMEPGNDPRVIQALKYATDRNAVFQLVQQGYGAVGRDTPVGPIYQTYYTDTMPLPARDVAKAKSLLAEAGHPNGLNLDMYLPNTLNFPDLAVVLKQQWAEAGINISVMGEPESVYYGGGKWLDVNLGITGWGSRPYPQFYIDVMLVCGAKWNETRFCDQEFDHYAAIAGSSLDEQTRVNAYYEIQRILIDRGPLIVPFFFAEYGVIRDQFEGFRLNSFAGRSDLRTVHLAQ